jgi:hypothetical protein
VTSANVVTSGMVLLQPGGERAQRQLELGDRRRRARQPAAGQPLLRDRLHPWRQLGRLLALGHQLAGLGVELTAMVEHDLELVQVGDPALRDAVEEPAAGRVEELEVGTLGEEPDRRQQLDDVILGDRADVAHAGAQRDPGDRPVHRLASGAALKPQSRGLVDQLSGSQVDPELGCRLERREVAERQQPRVIKRRVATQGEVDQVAASPV